MDLFHLKIGIGTTPGFFQLLLDVLFEKDKHCFFNTACSYTFCNLKRSNSSSTCSLEFIS